jgi:hypothetical protein
MMPGVRKLALAASALALSSCFNTEVRMPFEAEGEKQVLASMKPGKVRFAADVEVHYSGDAVGRFDVDFLQNDRVVSHATCDPLRQTGSQSCIYRYGNQDQRCSFVMNCSATLPVGGPTVVRVRFSLPTKPADFTLHRADLVVGQ